MVWLAVGVRCVSWVCHQLQDGRPLRAGLSWPVDGASRSRVNLAYLLHQVYRVWMDLGDVRISVVSLAVSRLIVFIAHSLRSLRRLSARRSASCSSLRLFTSFPLPFTFRFFAKRVLEMGS